MAFLVDVHAHLQDEQLIKDCAQIVKNAANAGVERIINAGCSVKESLCCIEIAKQYKSCKALVGLHPQNANEFNGDTVKSLKAMLNEPCVLGIGEIGLDYHYDCAPHELQKEVFKAQWLLACEANKPVELHIRDAYDDFFACINGLPKPPKVLLHCFSGGLDDARRAVDMGFSFSIGGVITYKKSDETRAVFKLLPDNLIHLETDCPYLAPQPKRGKRNEPAFLPMTLEALAHVKRLSTSALKERLYKNAVEFFGEGLL